MNLSFRFFALPLMLAALAGCATPGQATADHLAR